MAIGTGSTPGGALLAPRPYQVEAIKAIEAALNRGVRRPAAVLATGLGKTVVFAHLIQRRHNRPFVRPGGRTLVIAHRDELIKAAVEKIRDVAPELRVGIVKGARNETRADVVVASVATLARSEARRRMIADIDMIVCDEAHHAAAESYLRVLAHYGAWGDGEPVGQSMKAVAIGFTATMQRGDDKALGDVWQEVVFVMGVAEGVRSGYLSRPRGVRVMVEDLDLANVKKTRGEFQNGDLGRAVEDSMAPEAIAKAIQEHSPNEPGLVFTPTIHSAHVVAEAMASTGLSVEPAWGAMGDDKRERLIERFKAGEVDWMVNAQLFSEGTDLPRARTAVIARPTKSPVMLAQMAGRVLRLYRDPRTGALKNTSLLLFVDGRTTGYSLSSQIELFGEKPADLSTPDLGPDNDELGDQLEELDLGLSGEPVPRDRDEVPGRNGPLISEEVDLFGSSKSAWCRTFGGVWFLAAGERLIALIPGVEANTWDVTAMHGKEHGTGRWVATGVHELSYAMAWAEADVTAAEKTTAARDRGWRKTKTIEGKQLDFARKLGHVVHAGMTKGEISDLIGTTLASRRIDPYIPDYARGR